MPSQLLAGAWLQDPGSAYIRLSGGYLGTDVRFDPNGEKIPFDETIPETRYQDLTFALYSEVGVGRDFTLIGNLSWKSLQADEPQVPGDSTVSGLGDIQFGIKLALGKRKTQVASVLMIVTLPSGYDPNDYPALGSDVAEVVFGAQVGDATRKSWVNGEGFYKFRAGEFRDQLGGALSMGLSVSRRVSLRGEFRGEVPLGESRIIQSNRFDPTELDPSFLDLAGTASFSVGAGVALEAELRSTIAGKNTLDGTRLMFAVATQVGQSVSESVR